MYMTWLETQGKVKATPCIFITQVRMKYKQHEQLKRKFDFTTLVLFLLFYSILPLFAGHQGTCLYLKPKEKEWLQSKGSVLFPFVLQDKTPIDVNGPQMRQAYLNIPCA